jgi:hypothetical protein
MGGLWIGELDLGQELGGCNVLFLDLGRQRRRVPVGYADMGTEVWDEHTAVCLCPHASTPSLPRV